MGYVEERLWWPIQSPNKGRKKKTNREIRSSLLILDLKDDKLWDSGKLEGKMFHKLQLMTTATKKPVQLMTFSVPLKPKIQLFANTVLKKNLKFFKRKCHSFLA